MKRVLPKTIRLIALAGIISYSSYAQVGIGTTNPNPDAILDIDASTLTGGLLLPRMALTATNNTAPLNAHVAGMTVYNIATSLDVTPGYYYNDGTQWVRVMGEGATSTAADDKWDINGNTGTTTDHFLGTTDNIGLRIRTNNVERMRITNDGRILATQPGTAATPLFAWTGDDDKGFYSPGANQLGIVTGGNERLRFPNEYAVHAMGNGNGNTPFYSWNDDTNTGMWRSNEDRLNLSAGGREMVELQENGNNSIITFNDNGDNTDLRIESDNLENMLYVSATNNAIGIGTNTPTGALDITSTTNGFVPPRVELTAINVAAPVVNPQGGALTPGTTVYNTNTSGTVPDNVAPGLYYWNGDRWVAYAGSPGGLDWTLTGNTGTDYETNYLGTADDEPLTISTNGRSRAFLNSGVGEMSLNSTAIWANPSYIANDIFQSFATRDQTAVNGYSNGINGRAAWFQNFGGGEAAGIFSNGRSSLTSRSTANLGNGIQASGSNAPLYEFDDAGTGGTFAGQWGAVGAGTSATGSGVAGMGQGRTVIVVDPEGSGMATSGNSLGILAYAGYGGFNNNNLGNAAGEFVLDADNNTQTNGWNTATRARAKLAGFDYVTPDGGRRNRHSYYGGYFSGGSEGSNTPSYAYVGMRYYTNNNGNGVRWGGQDFKVIGTGSNSTLIDGPEGEPRIMFSPEAPEILFQDFGVGQLKNGVAHIELDQILKKNIYVNDKHPLKVFITLEGECNGVFVTNKSANGFTVKELQNGTSNASFSWQIVANRADRVAPDGTMVSQHVGVRLPVGPGPVKERDYQEMELVKSKNQNPDKLKDVISSSTQEPHHDSKK